ncbi:MAG TPA: hypothetical protein VKX40_01060 [Aequorivita sp.]|nr:hypothetical protein [Aequorivita sp.]
MRILFLIIFLGTLTKGYPQFSKKNLFYGDVGFFWGNYSGFELGVNYIRNEKYSFQASYYHHIIEAQEMPADFRTSSLINLGPTIFPEVNVPDINHSFNILGGYIYNLNLKRTVRLNLQAGIAFLHMQYATNFQKRSSPVFFGDNYEYDFKYRNTVAVIINPRIDFPFFKGYGLSVSPLVEFGGRKTVYGVGLVNIFGITRQSYIDPNQDVEETSD